MNLCEKLGREKSQFTIMSGDYNEFSSVMLRLQVIGFSIIRCEPLEFLWSHLNSLLDGERDIFISAWDVFVGEDILDLHNAW